MADILYGVRGIGHQKVVNLIWGHIHGVWDLGISRYPAYSHRVCWITVRFNANSPKGLNVISE
jgi:hypothetical protein